MKHKTCLECWEKGTKSKSPSVISLYSFGGTIEKYFDCINQDKESSMSTQTKPSKIAGVAAYLMAFTHMELYNNKKGGSK